MPLTSDITINAAKFDPASHSAQSKQLNAHIEDTFGRAPQWYEVCLSLPLSPLTNLFHAS